MSKSKKPIPTTGEHLELMNQARGVAFSGSPLMPSTAQNVGAPVSDKDAWEKKRAIEKGLGFTDYVGAMYREDGFIDRGLGALVGHTHFDPDESWRPTEKSTWNDLTSGIPEEFHDEFYNTTSMAHALYTKDRILEKVKDREVLGTLETAGNVGRFAFGMVNPESLALGVATMGASKVAATVGGAKAIYGARNAAVLASKIDCQC